MTIAPTLPQQSEWAPLRWRQAWLTIDDNRVALDFVQTRAGGLALHLAFIAVLAASGQLSIPALGLSAVALLGMWALAAHRLAVLVAASAFYLLMRPFRIDGWRDLLHGSAAELGVHPMMLQAGSVVLVVAFTWAFLSALRLFPTASWAKRPVLSLIIGYFLIVVTALSDFAGDAVSSATWAFAGVLMSCLWMLAYAAVDGRSKNATPVTARALFLRPFWGGSAAPIGKNFGYLNKFAAKDDDDLAKTQLKGLKLAVWAVALAAVWWAYEAVLYDQLAVPRLQSAILSDANGTSLPVFASWTAVLSNYFLDLLVISVWGHLIVATVRMCGYRIPRNTVNPLAARSLADFWNRYFFYFKELLVDFFFYPAFVRYFKGNVKLRIAFATFCAAGLGNFLYHFMRETYVFADGDFWSNLGIFESAVFYSLALATGLIVSQLWTKKATPEDGFLIYEVLPRIRVIGFFCFLKIFDDLTGEGTLLERAGFAASLFGV